MYQLLAIAGTVLSKACWDVLATESQFGLLTALDPQVVSSISANGAVNVRRDLCIAEAYAFSKAFKPKRAAALLEQVTSHGVLGRPLESCLQHQCKALDKTIGSLVQWSPESLDACLRSPLHGTRPKLVRLAPRGEFISDRHCSLSVHLFMTTALFWTISPQGLRGWVHPLITIRAPTTLPWQTRPQQKRTQSPRRNQRLPQSSGHLRRHSSDLVSGPKRAST
jgi:hypothetical protein